MNFFGGGSDGVRKLEAQLKQRGVQLDNLDNALSATKKELAEQKLARESAEQEAQGHAKKVADVEQSNDKLSKELKQKNLYIFNLSSQLVAKAKELQEAEAEAREANSKYSTCNQKLSELERHKHGASTELQRTASTVKGLEEQLKAERADHANTLAGLHAELASHQQAVSSQKVQIAECERRLQSDAVDSHNHTTSLEHMRERLSELTAELAASRQQASAEAAALRAQLAEAQDAARTAQQKQREAQDTLLSARHQQPEQASQREAEGEMQQTAADSASGAAHGSGNGAAGGPEDEPQQLRRELEGKQEEIQGLNRLLAAAAAEVQELQCMTAEKSASVEAFKSRVHNMQAILGKRKECEGPAAVHVDAAVQQFDDLVAQADSLRRAKKDLEVRNENLVESNKRCGEAVSKLTASVAKMEAKIVSLAKERDGANKQAAEAAHKVADLQATLESLHGSRNKADDSPTSKEELRAGLADMDDELCRLRQESAAQQKQLQEQRAHMQGMEAQLRQRKDEARQAADAYQAAFDQAARAEQDAECARVELAEHTAQLQCTQIKLKEAKATLSQLRPADGTAQPAAALRSDPERRGDTATAATSPSPAGTAPEVATDGGRQTGEALDVGGGDVAVLQRLLREARERAAVLLDVGAAKDAELKALQEEVAAARGAAAEAVKRLQGVERQAADAAQQCGQLRERNRLAESSVEGLRDDVRGLQADLAAAQQAAAAADRERSALVRAEQELRAQLAQTAAQVTKEQRIVEQLREEVRRQPDVPAQVATPDAVTREALVEARLHLRDEQAKHAATKEAMLAEHTYFSGQVGQLEEMTRGQPMGTPSQAVHDQLQTVKLQLDAVHAGEPLSAIRGRTMTTPPRPASGALPSVASMPPLSACTSMGRPGTPRTALSARTPLSVKSNADAAEHASFWHRKYEQEAAKVSALESANRDLSVRVIQASASSTPRSARRASLAATTPTTVHGTPLTRARSTAQSSMPGKDIDDGPRDVPTLGSPEAFAANCSVDAATPELAGQTARWRASGAGGDPECGKDAAGGRSCRSVGVDDRENQLDLNVLPPASPGNPPEEVGTPVFGIQDSCG